MDSDRKARYRAQVAAHGGRRISVQLLPRDPVEEWAALSDRLGGDKAALLHLLGLARGAPALSDDVLLAALSARLRASPRAPQRAARAKPARKA